MLSLFRFLLNPYFLKSAETKLPLTIGGIHHYNLKTSPTNWPWSVGKDVLNDDGGYIIYRIVPVSVYSENQLDKLYIDSLLVKSYNVYLRKFCPSNVDEFNHSSSHNLSDIHHVIENNTTFKLETPKNGKYEINQTQLPIGNDIVILEIMKNEWQLVPISYILESKSKFRKAGCVIVVLLLFVIIYLIRNKTERLLVGKQLYVLNTIFFVGTILLWGWYYQSVIVVNEKMEIQAQERLNRLFDEDVAKIYPMIKEAAEISTFIKALEIDAVKDVYTSYGYKYEVEENLSRLFDNNRSLRIGEVKADRLANLIIPAYMHTSNRTDARRLKIKHEIQNLAWTIHYLMDKNPYDIEEREDGKRYIKECDSLKREVIDQLSTLKQDIAKLNENEARPTL
ncbi:MAG: hypothetical protein KBT27_03000 [Prevotellaceae bacterium]|nr:hypothetical protein [Candidatus Faecinaster equi]